MEKQGCPFLFVSQPDRTISHRDPEIIGVEEHNLIRSKRHLVCEPKCSFNRCHQGIFPDSQKGMVVDHDFICMYFFVVVVVVVVVVVPLLLFPSIITASYI